MAELIKSNVESKKGPKGITVEIDGDTSGLNAALDESTAKAEKLVSLLKEANGLIHSFKAID